MFYVYIYVDLCVLVLKSIQDLFGICVQYFELAAAGQDSTAVDLGYLHHRLLPST